MEHREVLAGPRGRAPQAGLLDLPDELLLPILRRVEDAYVASGQMSAEFLQLRAVCKRFTSVMDSAVTNLSRGIARKFCNWFGMREVADVLDTQLEYWESLRRVELHVADAGDDTLLPLLRTLRQGCRGLTALRLVRTEEPDGRRASNAIDHLTALRSLESLSLTGFQRHIATLPSLRSLRVLEADFIRLTCASPLPALEELILGDRSGNGNGSRSDSAPGRTSVLDVPHLHSLPRLRRLSLTRVAARQLRLPKSLHVLELVNVDLQAQLLSLDKDVVPELAVLLVVQEEQAKPFPLDPQGLSKLLSHHPLLRLKLQGCKSLPEPSALVPGTLLRLQTRLTALSLRAVQVPRSLEEALAALTALTELELGDLEDLEEVHLSPLNLQELRLERLSTLCVMEGLERQTRLTSLALSNLGFLYCLPDFHLFTTLTVLELTSLRLDNWDPDSCSDLPSLKVLRVSEVCQRYPPAASVPPREAPTQPPPKVPFSLDLGALKRLTELDLRGFAGSAVDLLSLPALENLHLYDCHEVSHLAPRYLVPYQQSLERLPTMPKLLTLNIASCPRLITVSCRLRHLQHLTMEGLPRLTSLGCLPANLLTLHVAACHSLEKLELGTPERAHILDQKHGLSLLEPLEWDLLPWQLRAVKLAGLPKLSGLVIKNAARLESLLVSDCPLVEVTLDNLPRLKAPYIHINDLYLHVLDCPLLPPAAYHPSPVCDPAAQPVVPPPRVLPQRLQVLRLIWLPPGHLALDQVALQTGLTHLTLEGLLLSHLPKELASLTGLSELILTDLEVDGAKALPPQTFSRVKKLTIAGGTDFVRWADLGTRLGCSAPPPQAGAGPVGPPEIGAVWCITNLALSELNVASLDLSQLASMQELSVKSCKSLTCLAGLTNLPHLTSVHLTQIPKLEELAIVSCPSLKSVELVSVSTPHLHLEDLPSLELERGSFHTHPCPLSHCSRTTCLIGADLRSLRSLKLRGLPCLSISLCNLEALETIEVTQCSVLNDVHLERLMSLISVELNEPVERVLGEGSSSALRPQDLSKCTGLLHLDGMPKLESVSCPPTFRNVVIRSCPTLTSFPINDFQYLESLELKDVKEAILPIWLKQARHLKKLDIGRPLLDG